MQIWTLLQIDNHAGTSPLKFLQAGCPSCHPTNSVKALKEKSSEGKAHSLSINWMCAGSEFQINGAETENVREVKLLVMPKGLAKTFVLEECEAIDGR